MNMIIQTYSDDLLEHQVRISMMAQRKISLLAVILATFGSAVYARAPQKIIGGKWASIEEFPYQVYLDILHGGVCGGTIIDKIHIMTAAHCIRPYGPQVSNQDISVITGTDNRDYRPRENVFHVLEATHHPEFNKSGNMENDIALLKLRRPIPFHDYRKPAELPIEPISAGTKVIFTGWGIVEFDANTRTGGPYSQYLKKLESVIVNQQKCQEFFGTIKIHSSQICAWTNGGGDLCSGDSGGPLSFNGVVVGIASRATCNRGFPAVYTPVYNYVPWIRMIMRTRESNVW